MTFREPSASTPVRALAGVAALSLGSLAIGGLGGWRPASVYASGPSIRSFALPCTGAPVVDDTGLQAAITTSVDGAVICIAQSITLSRTLVLDDTTITLVGDDSTVELTAPASDRHIAAGSTPYGDDTLAILDLTLKDGVQGYAQSGGAISSLGTHVVLQRSSFMNNKSGKTGGAIAIKDATLMSIDTDFISNSTNDLSSTGGAIEADDTVTIVGGLFDDNRSGGSGGAIWTNAPLLVTGATFRSNIAIAGPGGAIFTGGSVTITDTDFTNNTANDAGAIYAVGSVTTNGGTFTNNTADDTGGAIFAYDTVLVSYATFASNMAGTEGGAIYTRSPVAARNSTFFMNSADTIGAAVKASAISLAFVTSVDDSSAADSVFWAVAPPGFLTMVGSVISPAVGGGSACNTVADDSSYDSFATDGSCGSGDDTVTITTRGSLGFDDTLVTSEPTGAQVLIPNSTSILIGAAPFNLVPSITLDQLGNTRGPVTTTVGAVQVGSTPVPPSPAIPPGAPGEIVAIAGNRIAEVTWSAPASAGSFPITNYQVTNDIDGATCLLSVGPQNPLACTLTGLSNGTAYRFRVRALNGAGWGAWSDWTPPVTPTPSPVTKTIVITGSRTEVRGKLGVIVDGTATGMVGQQVAPWFRFPGQSGYAEGNARLTIPEDGEFSWQRRTSKKIYVYFRGEDVRSNRIIIQRE